MILRISDHEVFPTGSGVSLVLADRNRHGGRVAFVVSDHLRFCVRPDLREGNVESLWIELFPHSKRSLLICCVYRPPSKVDFYDLFTLECEKLVLHNAQTYQKVLVFGDLNSNLLNSACRQ